MEANQDNILDFFRLLASFCQQDHLNPLSQSAMVRMAEESLRKAEDQEKLSTHFGALGDLLREANFWALQENGQQIEESHVDRAVEEKIHRSDLIKEHIQEMIFRGSLLVETTGEAAGQINGISTLNLGGYLFGRPSRITATVGPGGQGIVDIEREVELGGAVHSKGVLIVSGYLAQRYAQDILLTLAGRLVFEQSYEGVEGDSASSAELFAILSALSSLPIKQGIAVTGSVNQYGEIQPIGAVNQKIEGFFEVCRAQGMTGDQGVIIPRRNLQNLMLSKDVVEAVRSGEFHVWAIDTVDQGISILTGVAAGTRDEEGAFPPDTVNYWVEQRLRDFAEYLRDFPGRNAVGPGGVEDSD
jgi:predicted ATP-dependent protease